MNDQIESVPMSAAEPVSTAPGVQPPADIYETRDSIVMLIDIAGASEDGLNITLHDRQLVLSARVQMSSPEGYTLLYAEHQDGNYERVFALPEDVDGERTSAVLKDGVLRLTLPKAAQAALKKIPVKTA